MVHMAARKYALVLKLQILEADWARLIHLWSLEELLLDTDPLELAKRLLRFVNKTKSFG